MERLRAIWAAALAALVLPAMAQSDTALEIDISSTSVFLTRRIHGGPAYHKHPAVAKICRLLHSPTTATGLGLACGATLLSSFSTNSDDDVPQLCSRFIGVLRRVKSETAADRDALLRFDVDAAKQQEDLTFWRAVRIGACLLVFIALMVRRQQLEEKRIAKLASRAVVAQPSHQDSREPPSYSTPWSTRTSIGSVSTQAPESESGCGANIIITASESHSAAELEQKISKRKRPQLGELQIKTLVPWGEGFVQQRKGWFEDGKEPQVTEQKPVESARARPTGDEIDEMVRQCSFLSRGISAGGAPVRTAGPTSHEIDEMVRQCSWLSRGTSVGGAQPFAHEYGANEIDDSICKPVPAMKATVRSTGGPLRSRKAPGDDTAQIARQCSSLSRSTSIGDANARAPATKRDERGDCGRQASYLSQNSRQTSCLSQCAAVQKIPSSDEMDESALQSAYHSENCNNENIVQNTSAVFAA